jgi:type IV fimbrial biogenesis protein FimT
VPDADPGQRGQSRADVMLVMRAMSSGRRARRHGGGFTLVELVAVVTLIGIGAVMAMPSLADAMRGQRLRAATTDLTSALLIARSEAIKRGSQVRIVPRAANDWATGWTVAGVNAGDQIDRKDALGVDVQVTRAPLSIVFDRTGRLAVPGLVRVQLAAGAQPPRCVTIDPSGLPRQSMGTCP